MKDVEKTEKPARKEIREEGLDFVARNFSRENKNEARAGASKPKARKEPPGRSEVALPCLALVSLDLTVMNGQHCDLSLTSCTGWVAVRVLLVGASS